MAKILIVYGTTEGQTRKICQHISAYLSANGSSSDVVDSANIVETLHLGRYDGFILAGSLHEGRHQAPLIRFAKDHATELHGRPSAFLSVSLTAVISDEKHTREARACMDRFYEDTGWTPTASTPVAGALLYTEYNFFKRLLLQMISKHEGGDTDTSRDYEYTDWAKLDRFVSDFVGQYVEPRMGVSGLVS